MSAHSWESEVWDWQHDSDDDGLTEQQTAGAEYMEVLLQQYFSGIMTATVFCLLCHWGAKAGLDSEAAGKYGLPPGRSSGKYKQHLDEQLEFKSQRRNMYQFSVPGRQRHSDDRVGITITARLDMGLMKLMGCFFQVSQFFGGTPWFLAVPYVLFYVAFDGA